MSKQFQETEIYYPYPVAYPENLKIWDKEAQKIKIINQKDFPEREIFKGLGINASPLLSSFGVIDPDEIKGRQDIMKWLHENRNIESWLLKEELLSFELPQSESKFLEFFRPGKPNPYWSVIRRFIELVDNSTSPPSRILELRNFYYDSLVLEKDEVKMVEIMSEKIQSMATIEGLATFAVRFDSVPLKIEQNENCSGPHVLAPSDLKLINERTCGYRKFSFAISDALQHETPGLIKKIPLVNKLAQSVNEQRNNREMKKAYSGTVISKASDGLIGDIENGIIAKLRFDWKGVGLLNNKKERIDGSRNLIIKVHYSYSNDGLRLKIYGLEDDLEGFNLDHKAPFKFKDCGRFDRDKLAIIEQTIKKYFNEANSYEQSVWNARKMIEIERSLPEVFRESFTVPSPRTDSENKWFAIQNLYFDPSVNQIYDALNKHRGFSNEHLALVGHMAFLSWRIRETAKKLHAKISFPEIVNDQHVVEFDKLYAIHLLDNSSVKEIIPVMGMDALNGKPICFTGKHNGGKTSTALGVAITVFLAQSGLPIIGQGFSFNPKEVLGLVFVSKGEGSTCTNLVDKMENLLSGIENVDGSKVILVIDELGIATQESDGYEFGIKVLNAINRRNASLLFTTQIIKLAEYSVDQLGGVSYCFERNHKMRPGIGDGGLEQLCKERGLDKYFA
jgi:hypothetical protein